MSFCGPNGCHMDFDYENRRPEESIADGAMAFQGGMARICPGNQGTAQCKDWLFGYDEASKFARMLDDHPYESYVPAD